MGTTLDYFAKEAPIPASTLTGLFYEAVDRFSDDVALQRRKLIGELSLVFDGR